MTRELTTRGTGAIAKTTLTNTLELQADWHQALALRVDAGEMAELTAKTYRRGMVLFLDWLTTNGKGDVTADVIREWKADLLAAGRKPGGVNVHFASIRNFYRWAAAERGMLDPTAGVPGAKGRQSTAHKRDALSDAEMIRLLAQPNPDTLTGKRDRAMLYLMAFTGVRSVEVQRAVVGDLHTNGNLKLYVRGKGHTDADEYVAIVKPDLLDALYSWLAVHPKGEAPQAALFCGTGPNNTGGALTLRAIRLIVKTYMRTAGIRDARKTTHSLRHSLVTNLIRQGIPATRIMAVTRHKNLATLGIYAHEIARDADPVEAYVDYGGVQ